MGNTTRRVKGALEELGGKAKAGVGKLVGNKRMEGEGRTAAVKGIAKQEVAKVAERVKGTVEEVAGSVETGAGELIDDKSMQIEGKAKELKGKARRAVNR